MRSRMKPITSPEGKSLGCANGQVWPPVQVLVHGRDLEAIRPSVGEVAYHKLKTWEKVCGLTSMELEKCGGCPHLVKDGVPVTKVGTGVRLPSGRPHKGQIVKRWSPPVEE